MTIPKGSNTARITPSSYAVEGDVIVVGDCVVLLFETRFLRILKQPAKPILIEQSAPCLELSKIPTLRKRTFTLSDTSVKNGNLIINTKKMDDIARIEVVDFI